MFILFEKLRKLSFFCSFCTFAAVFEHFRAFSKVSPITEITFAAKRNRMRKFIDDIAKDPKKGLIWAILIVILCIAVYFAWGKLKDIINNIITDVESVVDNPVDSDKLSYSSAWYKDTANSLFNAMDGMGTSWGVIETAIIAMKTQDDWNKTVREYGTRTLSRFLQSDLTGTLQVHLKDDCSKSEIAWIHNYMRLKNGINSGLM